MKLGQSWLAPIWADLAQRLSQGTLPHGLLVLGQQGVGKRALVDHLFAAALCANPQASAEPCGECRSCAWAAAGTHPDLYRCAPEPDSKVIKVDQIRALSQRAALTSAGTRQVFLVDPADRMNVNAANALLKTLEEPGSGTMLVLIAENRSRLPATIISRCQQILVPLPTTEAALEWLAEQSVAPTEDHRLAIRAAAGSPGRALAYLAEDALGEIAATAESLQQLATEAQPAIDIARGWQESNLGQRLDWLFRWLVAMAAPGQPELPMALKSLNVQADRKSLIILAEQVGRGRQLLETPARPELVIEDILIQWQKLFKTTNE